MELRVAESLILVLAMNIRYQQLPTKTVRDGLLAELESTVVLVTGPHWSAGRLEPQLPISGKDMKSTALHMIIVLPD